MFVTPDGGLTGAGYALFIAIGVAALIGASFLAGKVSKKAEAVCRQPRDKECQRVNRCSP